MGLFKKKEKWHDGYYLQGNDIIFYVDPPLSKVSKGETNVYLKNSDDKFSLLWSEKKVEKVNQDKITTYENWCNTYKNDFLKSGMLRLHTPTEIHQEHLGIEFLFVPISHRERINQLIGDNYLSMINPLELFKLLPSGKELAFANIIGSGVLIELEKAQSNPVQIDNPLENRFFIGQFLLEDMFTYYDQTKNHD